MVRYGILSTAQVVPRFIKGVRESREGEVVAIASRELEKAQKAANEWQIPRYFGSYEALCQCEEVDIVYIAVYNKGHYEAAKSALENHKHVLLEKPFTLNSDQAESLFKLAEENQCFLMEAQKSLFLPITNAVRHQLQNGRIGRLRWMESVTAYPNIDHVSWFRDLDAGGGILHGAGSYPLEYMQFITGSTPLEATGVVSFPENQSDAQANVVLRFEEEVTASIFMTVALDLPRKLTLYGEKGKIIVPDFWRAQVAEFHEPDGTVELLHLPFTNEFVFEVEHVNQCLQAGRLTSDIVTKELTVTTVKLTEDFYRKYGKA